MPYTNERTQTTSNFLSRPHNFNFLRQNGFNFNQWLHFHLPLHTSSVKQKSVKPSKEKEELFSQSNEGIAFSNGYFHTINHWLDRLNSNPETPRSLEISITFTKYLFVQALVRNLPKMFPSHLLSSKINFDQETKECTLTIQYHTVQEVQLQGKQVQKERNYKKLLRYLEAYSSAYKHVASIDELGLEVDEKKMKMNEIRTILQNEKDDPRVQSMAAQLIQNLEFTQLRENSINSLFKCALSKPLLMHNSLNDLLHLLNCFTESQVRKANSLDQMVKNANLALIDTKTLLHHTHSKQLKRSPFSSKSLSPSYQTAISTPELQSFCSSIRIQLFSEKNETQLLSQTDSKKFQFQASQHVHDAGYDAFMTGVLGYTLLGYQLKAEPSEIIKFLSSRRDGFIPGVLLPPLWNHVYYYFSGIQSLSSPESL